MRREESKRKNQLFDLEMANEELRSTNLKLEDELRKQVTRYDDMMHRIFDEPEPIDLTELPEPTIPTHNLVAVKVEQVTPKNKKNIPNSKRGAASRKDNVEICVLS